MAKKTSLEQSLKAALCEEFGKAQGEKLHKELLRIEDYQLSTTLFGREVVFDDLPALGRQCLHEILGSLVVRRGLAAPAESTAFCSRIVSCLEKAKGSVEDRRSLPLHGCAFAFEYGKDTCEMECVARRHMKRNWSDSAPLALPRRTSPLLRRR